jgi:prolyl-tRNA editing enzyme YbaK/EbsC (Cys-tRNA(Pro) deacylase)
MSLPVLGDLAPFPASSHPELVAPPVGAALAGWPLADGVGVVEIDPAIADTAAMMASYTLPMSVGANCVIVAGRRDGEERIAACVVRADTRVDVNTLVKRRLDVRKPSFLSMERAVAESGMEYGGITPLGVPTSWRIFVDSAIAEMEVAIIGSGVRRSKLLLSGELLTRIPRAEVVEGLGR